MRKIISIFLLCIVVVLLSFFVFDSILEKDKMDDVLLDNNNSEEYNNSEDNNNSEEYNNSEDNNIINNEENEDNNSNDIEENEVIEIIIDNSFAVEAENLELLDKTSYDWWITLNKENMPPRTDERYYPFIEDRNGYFLGDTDTKTIYLTFDEGYENGYTPLILDTLKKNNIKTVFFITEGFLNSSPDLVQRMIDEGHIIGNHTCTHPDLTLKTFDEIKKEIDGLDQKIFDKFGIHTSYFRAPMGKLSEYTLACTDYLGYKTIFWSYAYDDWDTSNIRGADYAYNIITSHAHNGAIYLIHAVSKDNAEALDRIITWFIENGYTLAQLDL